MKIYPITGILLRACEPKFILIRSENIHHEVFEIYKPNKEIEIIRILLRILDEEIDGFLSKFEKIDNIEFNRNPHRKRRYISKEKKKLFPYDNEDFATKHLFTFKNYYICKNIGSREIAQYVKEMTIASNISFGLIENIKL